MTRIRTGTHEVSAAWNLPAESPRAGLVLAHGAGGHRDHPTVTGLADALAAGGLAVLRFNFPYAEAGRRRPDPGPVLLRTWLDVWAWGRGRPETAGVPLAAGGRSMGGRLASMAAAEEAGFDPLALVLFAYPLHPAGRPERLRDAHLAGISRPMLFLSGTRDRLAGVGLLTATVENLGSTARLHWLEGADHGFHVLKRSGRTDDDVVREAAETATAWLCGLVTAEETARGGAGKRKARA